MRIPFFGPKKPAGPIRLALPEAVDVGYLVYFRSPVAAPPNPAQLRPVIEAWLRHRSEDPLRAVLSQMLERDLLMLEVGARGEMPEPPPHLIAAWGPGELEERRFSEATHGLLIGAQDLLGPPRMGFWLALAAARALAEASGGVVLDPVFPRLLPIDLHQEALPPKGEIRVGQHIMVPQSVGARGMMWTTSKGLSRFGLPELEVRDTPPNLGPSVGYVVNGAAQHLMRHLLAEAHQHQGPLRELSIPPMLRVSLEDILSARAPDEIQPPPEGARGWIEVGLEHHPGGRNRDSFLQLTPLPGSREKPGVWWATELTELFGAGESTLRNVKSDSEAMEAAHMQAMSELPRARSRFAAGLQPGEMLIVKHGFPTGGDQHEYMWLCVTRWRGDRLTCQLMNTPEIRRDLRQGQTVELREAELFDWALQLANGQMEGGYTNRVVMGEHGEE